MTGKVILLTSAVWCSIASLLLMMKYSYNIPISSILLMNSNNRIGTRTKKLNTTKFIHNQAYWAYKMEFMEQPEDIPDEKRICFVHVGKTAGSTLACYLGFDYSHCATGENNTYSTNIPSNKLLASAYDTIKEMIPSNSILPHVTTSMIHKSTDSCLEDIGINNDHMSMYLFIVRNPYSRIQSWFEYERINNKTTTNIQQSSSYQIKKPLYIDCQFQTLNQLGGKTGLGGKNNTLCSRRAFRAISGVTGYNTHNYYNYQYYYNKVLNDHTKNPNIIVIRTEHIEYDYNQIEINILHNIHGPPLNDNYTFTHKNKSPKLLDDMYIDIVSKHNICAALCYEIQTYKMILQNAINLNKIDYITSMNELSIDCPIQVGTNTC